jgi:hypothetical protein
MKYQLIVLGPEAGRYPALLGNDLAKEFESLGLRPAADYLEALAAAQAGQVHWKGNPVGVWFGGAAPADQADLDLLRQLLDRSAPVLPLVEDKKQFTALVSHDPDLRPINGRQWDDDRVVTDVLRLMRLTRDERQAFISYKRSDSQPVANQLFDGFSGRGYRAFLDTASVEAATRFQEVLHGRLADMDLVVFLDSSTACESQWVIDELTLANNLGLTVLQLAWPNKKPFAGAALSKLVPLAPADFVQNDHGPGGRFTDAALVRVMAEAERVRVESLGYRRRRVVGELVDHVADHDDLKVVVKPIGPLEVRDAKTDKFLGWALPLVGVPTDRALREEHSLLGTYWEDYGGDMKQFQAADPKRFRVLYDGLGVDRGSQTHLVWLNKYLPLQTLFIDRDRQHPVNPVEQWLSELKQGAAP